MKYSQGRSFNNQGSILIVVVAMLTLLVLLTVSIGRKANQELLLVKYSLEKMQARYLAWAGFHYTLDQIRKDSFDKTSASFDNQYACGVHLSEDQAPEDIFKEISVGNGSFSILTERGSERFGMRDEDGKINLNALNVQNNGILIELFVGAGMQPSEAEQVASMVLDWRDEDSQPVLQDRQDFEGPYVVENLETIAKNRPFDHVEEMMFIPGVTVEFYDKIKDHVTVFPRQANALRINLATASPAVLLALARYFSGPQTNTSYADAESLIAKVIDFRAGPDRIEGTFDDQELKENEMRLSMSEQILFRAMNQTATNVSRFLVFSVKGYEKTNSRQSTIDAIVDRETLTVVSWRND